MKIYNTEQGLARLEGADLLFLDVDVRSLESILQNGELARLASCATTSRVPLTEPHVWTPLLNQPGQFIIAGLNYLDHCKEIGVAVPEKLVFGTAPGLAVNASGRDIEIPSPETDYEGEIGVVIGKLADTISADNAWDYIAGLVPLNDVSARDVQAARTMEALAQAKGFPGFKPMGPCFATVDEFEDRNAIGVRTWVNGELRQDGNSRDMVFSIPKIIEIVSAKIPLAPGDVVCTGTPGGVAHGGKFPYLKNNDEVVIELSAMPALSNRFVQS